MNPRKYKKLSENIELSHKQQQAVAELLKSSHKSYKDIARALGISSCCLYNWRNEPKFQEALDNGINELKERVLSAAEFSVQLDSVNSMLDCEAKVVDALYLIEAVIKIMENQERLRLKLKTITEEVELLKVRIHRS